MFWSAIAAAAVAAVWLNFTCSGRRLTHNLRRVASETWGAFSASVAAGRVDLACQALTLGARWFVAQLLFDLRFVVLRSLLSYLISSLITAQRVLCEGDGRVTDSAKESTFE